MSRFPSVIHVIDSARETAQRFPWVLLSALVSACLSWFLVVGKPLSQHSEELLSRWLLVAILGISIFFALAIGLEHSKLVSHRHWIGLALGAVILMAFFFSYNPDTPRIYIYRFLQLAVASHLLVAVSPFYHREVVTSFWQFNRRVFQRILQSVLFSGILFVGLTIALWAIQSLLGLNVEWKAYYFLFLAIGYLFNTWFFLAGTPTDWHSLELDTEYPAGLRLFVQFILLPLVTLYVLILYAYLFKIVWIREWPHGTIGWLVSIVSVVGMLALLLVHPLRNQPGYRWIRFYSRSFYLALFPLIILLLMAVWRRVSEYGLTEDRYFLIVLSFWMTGIAFYFTSRGQPSIKLIPVSLAVLAVLTVGGPWGPYSVCRRSQLNRLRIILGRTGILNEGHIQKLVTPLEYKDRKEISAIVTYLLETHGIASLQPWFVEDLRTLRTRTDYRAIGNVLPLVYSPEVAAKVTELMGVSYVRNWENPIHPKEFFASVKPTWQEARSISGYDYLSRFSFYKSGAVASTQPFNIGPRHFDLFWDASIQTVEFREGKKVLVSLSLKPFLEHIQQQTGPGSNTGLSESLLSLEGESDSARIKLYFENISGTRDDSGIQLISGHGELLVKLKTPD